MINSQPNLDVCLIQLPFANFNFPSPACGLLKAELAKGGLSCRVEYADLRFLKEIGVKTYLPISGALTISQQTGERVFAALTGLPMARKLAEYCDFVAEFIKLNHQPSEIAAEIRAELPELEKKAAAFLDAEAARIAALQPKVVACPSIFFQVNSVIAFLRRLKAIAPAIITLVGGANCLGQGGIALANLVPWIDYTFSGEADECIADLCRILIEKGNNASQDELPYGAIKKGAFRLGGNAPCRATKNLDAMAIPDYTDFYEEFYALGLNEYIEPAIPVEFSRGCWWHDRKPCSFCGLNPPGGYRTKSTERAVAEARELKDRYKLDGICLTDNILSYEHLRDVLPQLKPLKCRFFSEVKSNLTRQQIATLYEAGFRYLQPGIESLHDGCLELMNKGNRAIKHIEFLKTARRFGLMVFWNIIAGFPSEKASWYAEMLELAKKITHFQAPGRFRPLVYQRNNAYWREPQRYGLNLRPSPIYDYVYTSLPGFIENVAYNFSPVDEEEYLKAEIAERRGEEYAALAEFIEDWRLGQRSPDRLTMRDDGETIEIFDLRQIAKQSISYLSGVEAAVYRTADAVISLAALNEQLADKYSAAEIAAAVKKLDEDSLIVRIGEEILALALPEDTPPISNKFPGRVIKLN